MTRLTHLLTTVDDTSQDETDKGVSSLPYAWQAPILAWLTLLAATNYSPHTQSAYERAVVSFARFLVGCGLSDFAACQKSHLIRYVSERLEVDGVETGSIKQALSAIKHWYDYLIKAGQATHNPTDGFRLKKGARALPVIADVDLVRQLLEQAPPTEAEAARLWVRDKAMFELAYSSGLRVSELVGLDVGDVDMSAGTVRVLGKGQKMRVVPVGSKALAAILEYLPHRDMWQERDDTALFISERLGTRLSTRTVQLRLKVAARTADIDLNLYPHLLRHCFASHMLSASGDLRAVQEMLGHSDVGTTEIYTHVDFVKLTQVYDTAHPRARLGAGLETKLKAPSMTDDTP
ncbi:MAG: tyrosine recombinase XerC [Moraxella sp.]|nr:tyrosine recombinase XerC [Moraxella sp.]